MKRRIPTRIFSLFLAFVLLVSSCPPVYAAENLETTEPAVVAEPVETEAAETTAAAETTEDSAETEPAAETTLPAVTEPSAETEAPVETEVSEETLPVQTAPAETVPEETAAEETTPAETVPEETVTEETLPEETVTEETVPEETVPEETVEEETAIVMPGMPESYVLSEEALAEKQTMIEIALLEDLAALTAGEDYVENEILATPETEEEAALMAAAFNGELVEFFEGFAVIRLLECSVLEAVTASLDLTQNLPVVSPDYIYRIDSEAAEVDSAFGSDLPEKQSWHTWVQENMSNADSFLRYPKDYSYQFHHDVIDTYAAWGVSTGDSWVKVALIDSGVDTTHEDLATVTGVDIGYGTGDYVGHGTHLAGIIAATMDNGVGGAGIAPGVTIRSYRTVSGTSTNPTSSARVKGIRQAINDSCHIINLSITSFQYSSTEQYWIKAAVDNGITVIAAAGNNGSNTKLYPAAMDGVIAVAATDRTGARMLASNYGPWVDISAPGLDIVSTATGGGYSYNTGTSMAAAVVTGVAALYTSAVGERVAPATLEKVMKKAATKVTGSGMGAGIVNAANMLDDKPDAPYIVLHDEDGYIYKSGSTIPCESYVGFWESKESYDNWVEGDERGRLVVTFDGKNPSVKNGVIVNGMVVDDFNGYSLSGFAGTTVTIKAAFVSGMGIVGKVATVKAKVAESLNVSSLSINGSTKLIAGKSCTYTAKVNPVDTANQSVVWDIYGWYGTNCTNSQMKAAVKINSKTGKLTTTAGKTGYVYVRATSTVDSNIYSMKRVYIVSINPVSKITLNYSGMSNPYTLVGLGFQLRITSMVDKYGFEIDPTISGVRWTSSNPKVASIDSNGNVSALSKGTTTLTCLTLDGSGKTAKVKLTVKQPVTSIGITGNKSIAPGSSATYKATVGPSNANNKKVTWVLSGAPAGVTINASTGKVTVPAYVSLNSYFYIRAYAQDKPTITDNSYASYLVYVRQKCSAVNIGVSSSNVGYAGGPTYNSSGYVKTINLFSVDLPNTTAKENQITMQAYRSGTTGSTAVMWKTSNPDIVSINGSVITAHKAGTVTLTLQAMDGSNKKATCKVVVTNPVSSMDLRSSTLGMDLTTPFLAIGKSVKHTVGFQDTYGVPSNKKVAWSFTAVQVDSNGNTIKDWTKDFTASKLITVKNGTLTVKSGVRTYWNNMSGELLVTVTAQSTDGTRVSASYGYVVVRPTTKMSVYSRYKTTLDNAYHAVTFTSNQYNPYGYMSNHAFIATSSNPNVIGIEAIEHTSTSDQYRVVYTTRSRGTAKITIKAADGSNKSCSFTITVQ